MRPGVRHARGLHGHRAVSLLGCAGKSAQLPLYIWLPDAMAGPTPVSALIHAATMVTAGVYLVARAAPIFAGAPSVSLFVTLIGAITALFAATIALRQWDIKKVLAYSTVSQLGYMFVGCGYRCVRGRSVPSGHARVLQGAAVPRGRVGDSRHARGVSPRARPRLRSTGLAQHGRTASRTCR
jgi:NADH:ubiquinone oxidoreductase subunit 5 (subunit L)/multisubunit Na+/H+ antiporter MnhA subunit